MVGRGTRTCNNLFGPGRDKECFWIFDLCQNLEFFLGQGGAESPAAPETLSTRLFRSRLALIDTIDQKALPSVLPSVPSMAIPSRNGQPGDQDNALGLHRHTLAELLRCHVAACPADNFLVRPHLQLVERFRNGESWAILSPDDHQDLAATLAPLALRLRRAAGRHRCGRPPFRSAALQPAAHPVAR
jgi:type I restriction enzyme R subunit